MDSVVGLAGECGEELGRGARKSESIFAMSTSVLFIVLTTSIRNAANLFELLIVQCNCYDDNNETMIHGRWARARIACLRSL